MTDPERFDGDDGLTLSYLSSLAEPNYQAELAELRAQVRYALDDTEELQKRKHNPYLLPADLLPRLRELVGPWPHEVKP